MKATVDKDLCTGCELCTLTAPDVFEMQAEDNYETARVKDGAVDAVPPESEEWAKQAAEECPVEAITIE